MNGSNGKVSRRTNNALRSLIDICLVLASIMICLGLDLDKMGLSIASSKCSTEHPATSCSKLCTLLTPTFSTSFWAPVVIRKKSLPDHSKQPAGSRIYFPFLNGDEVIPICFDLLCSHQGRITSGYNTQVRKKILSTKAFSCIEGGLLS